MWWSLSFITKQQIKLPLPCLSVQLLFSLPPRSQPRFMSCPSPLPPLAHFPFHPQLLITAFCFHYSNTSCSCLSHHKSPFGEIQWKDFQSWFYFLSDISITSDLSNIYYWCTFVIPLVHMTSFSFGFSLLSLINTSQSFFMFFISSSPKCWILRILRFVGSLGFLPLLFLFLILSVDNHIHSHNFKHLLNINDSQIYIPRKIISSIYLLNIFI